MESKKGKLCKIHHMQPLQMQLSCSKRTTCIYLFIFIVYLFIYFIFNIYLFFTCFSQNYKRDLANERADRAKTEREVIELIKDMKKKWKTEAAKKAEEYEVKINVSGKDILSSGVVLFSSITEWQRHIMVHLYMLSAQ